MFQRLPIALAQVKADNTSEKVPYFFAKNMGKNNGKDISKNFSGKYSQKLLDHVKKSAADPIKTSSK